MNNGTTMRLDISMHKIYKSNDNTPKLNFFRFHDLINTDAPQQYKMNAIRINPIKYPLMPRIIDSDKEFDDGMNDTLITNAMLWNMII